MEDNRVGVSWSVLPEVGAVLLTGLSDARLPWHTDSPSLAPSGNLAVVPRGQPNQTDLDQAAAISEKYGTAAVAVPANADLSHLNTGETIVLRCPDRLPEIDHAIEVKLLASRLARA